VALQHAGLATRDARGSWSATDAGKALTQKLAL
jgi:hypothetical protein